MKIKKTAATLAAIIGFAILVGGCDGALPADTEFQTTVAQWQNSTPTYLDNTDGLRVYGEISSAPALYDVDGNGTQDLVVGDAFGYIEIMINSSYDGINISDSYMVGNGSGPAYFCDDAAPTIYDVNDDGVWEMIVGCGDGTLMAVYFLNQTPNEMVFFTAPITAGDTTVALASGYAVPAVGYVGGADDTLPDLVVGAGDGSITYYLNNGTLDAPMIEFAGNGLAFGNRAAVASEDLNGDGVGDLVVGNEAGEIFACQAGMLNGCVIVLTTAGLAKPAVGDINHDGMMDLVVGTVDGSIEVYLGTLAP